MAQKEMEPPERSPKHSPQKSHNEEQRFPPEREFQLRRLELLDDFKTYLTPVHDSTAASPADCRTDVNTGTVSCVRVDNAKLYDKLYNVLSRFRNES